MKQYHEEKTEPFPGKGRQNSQAALIGRLRRENERLRKERDFQKNSRVVLLCSGFAGDAVTKESHTEWSPTTWVSTRSG